MKSVFPKSLFSIPQCAGCAADFSSDKAFCRRNTGVFQGKTTQYDGKYVVQAVRGGMLNRL